MIFTYWPPKPVRPHSFYRREYDVAHSRRPTATASKRAVFLHSYRPAGEPHHCRLRRVFDRAPFRRPPKRHHQVVLVATLLVRILRFQQHLHRLLALLHDLRLHVWRHFRLLRVFTNDGRKVGLRVNGPPLVVESPQHRSIRLRDGYLGFPSQIRRIRYRTRHLDAFFRRLQQLQRLLLEPLHELFQPVLVREELGGGSRRRFDDHRRRLQGSGWRQDFRLPCACIRVSSGCSLWHRFCCDFGNAGLLIDRRVQRCDRRLGVLGGHFVRAVILRRRHLAIDDRIRNLKRAARQTTPSMGQSAHAVEYVNGNQSKRLHVRFRATVVSQILYTCISVLLLGNFTCIEIDDQKSAHHLVLRFRHVCVNAENGQQPKTDLARFSRQIWVMQTIRPRTCIEKIGIGVECLSTCI